MPSKLALFAIASASLLSTLSASAQVDVTATAGTPTASYTTLKDAFDAINAGTHQGAIGSASAATRLKPRLRCSTPAARGRPSYTTIPITPTGGAARTISGAIAAGIAADRPERRRQRHDRRPQHRRQFADDRQYDRLGDFGHVDDPVHRRRDQQRRSPIRTFRARARHRSPPMARSIFFSTDAVTANGNDNNTISNNNIGPAGANLPTKAILGNGSTTTTAIGNSGIVITNNNIFDYFGAAVTSSGVATNAGCNAWTITNNRFYQTGTRTWTTGAHHRAIDIRQHDGDQRRAGLHDHRQHDRLCFEHADRHLHADRGRDRREVPGILFNGITAGTTDEHQQQHHRVGQHDRRDLERNQHGQPVHWASSSPTASPTPTATPWAASAPRDP